MRRFFPYKVAHPMTGLNGQNSFSLLFSLTQTMAGRGFGTKHDNMSRNFSCRVKEGSLCEFLYFFLCVFFQVSGYPNTERRVENMTRSRIFLTEFEVFG